MKNSLRIHKWTHNEFNIFILGVLTRPLLRFGILSNPNRSLGRILYFFMTACRLLPVKFPICETCLTN